MKTTLALLLGFILAFGQAQEVSDYKYISIPSNFSGFSANQYQLNNYLRLLLTQKDYKILSNAKKFWPEEAKLNPFLVLAADLDQVSSTFSNKVLLSFTDCNDTVLYKFEGESKVKEFEAGYKDALNNAVASIKKQQAQIPTYREEETKEVVIKTETKAEHPGTELFKKYSNKLDANNLELNNMPVNGVYILEGKTYFKSNLENGEFVLLNEDKKHMVAHFYPSSKKGVYHVYLGNSMKNSGNSLIAYFDGNKLSYEYLSADKSPIVIEFTPK